MSNHPTQEQLAEFVYGELTPQLQIEIARHVDGCAECGALVGEWRGVRVAMQGWEIPRRSEQTSSAPRRSWTPQIVRWAAAAVIMLGLGYGVGKMSAMRSADVPQLRAQIAEQLRGELRGELRDELHSEFAKFVSDQSAEQQQSYQRALVQAANQLDARRLADYANLRRDVETVALQTQQKFDSLSVPQESNVTPNNP